MVSEDRWSLNTSGRKDRFHCTNLERYILNVLTKTLAEMLAPSIRASSPSQQHRSTAGTMLGGTHPFLAMAAIADLQHYGWDTPPSDITFS